MSFRRALNAYTAQLKHYAWFTLAIVFGLQTVSTGMRMAFGAFIDPLQEAFGWSQGSIGLAYSIQFIASALFSPVAGWLSEVYGTRRAIFAGIALFIIGLALTGTITELWQFYLYYGIIIGAALSVFTVCLVTTVGYWFRTHKGLAIGITMASQGVGPALAAPVVTAVIATMGWKPAMLALAIGGGLIMFALTTRFYSRPEDKGIKPYGALEEELVVPRPTLAADRARASAFIKRARGTFNFWNLANIHFLGCVGHSIIIVYAVPMAIHKGIDPVVAAGVLATFMAISAVTRFATPVLSELFSPKTVMAVSYFLQGATVFMLLWADTPWQFYLFAVIFGIGFGGEGSVFPIINYRYYRNAPVGTAYGWQMFGAGFGMALGGWIGGWLFDITDAYTLTILVSAATSLGGMASILALANPQNHLIPDWDRGLTPETLPEGMEGLPISTH